EGSDGQVTQHREEKTPEKQEEYAPHIFASQQQSSRLNKEEIHKTAYYQEAFMEEETVTNLFSRLLADLTSDSPGIGVVYKALHELVETNQLNDAVLVV